MVMLRTSLRETRLASTKHSNVIIGTSLSVLVCFIGDFRSVFGEDKSKVDNIVSANLPKFHKLYHPYMHDLTVATSQGRMRKVFSFYR